uniref:Uncharacterized protein n=1 Tax=uncultured prokaryote TaxID=198431 RepID=A0A0H5Q5L9_9ZZZZ|nr:hypothetical protein [uncultured prokaryote]
MAKQLITVEIKQDNSAGPISIEQRYSSDGVIVRYYPRLRYKDTERTLDMYLSHGVYEATRVAFGLWVMEQTLPMF